ncbi:MAG: hypothetical protein ACJAYE_003656 [Candidatus Azotimanducaceae bacterium]|jgi:hypothetical protein
MPATVCMINSHGRLAYIGAKLTSSAVGMVYTAAYG